MECGVGHMKFYLARRSISDRDSAVAIASCAGGTAQAPRCRYVGCIRIRTMRDMNRSLVRLAFGLAASIAAAPGCMKSVVNCGDCPPDNSDAVTVVGASGATIQTSGECGKPTCAEFGDGAPCALFTVQLYAVGTCQVTVTTVDGRRGSDTVTIQESVPSQCCGPMLRADHAVVFVLSPPDAASSDAGDGDAAD
jgi:hypothetical protein